MKQQQQKVHHDTICCDLLHNEFNNVNVVLSSGYARLLKNNGCVEFKIPALETVIFRIVLKSSVFSDVI